MYQPRTFLAVKKNRLTMLVNGSPDHASKSDRVSGYGTKIASIKMKTMIGRQGAGREMGTHLD